jgi:hypothetical protein
MKAKKPTEFKKVKNQNRLYRVSRKKGNSYVPVPNFSIARAIYISELRKFHPRDKF